MNNQSKPPFPRSFRTLEAGRGIAAMMVVAYHALDILKLRDDGPHLFTFGYSGVDFFFVLSGFIILYAHRADFDKPHRVPAYLWKRFIRIYPIYWVVAAALIVAMFLIPDATSTSKRAPLFIMRSLLLLPVSGHPLLGVTWSLSYEVIFYLVFAITLINRRVAAITSSLWILAVVFGHHLSQSFAWSYLTDRHIEEFAMGAVVALSYRRIRSLPLGWLGVLGGAIYLLIGLANSYHWAKGGQSWDAYYGFASMLVVLGCVVHETNHVLNVPRSLTLLGAASYSIYLTHFPVMLLLARVTGGLSWTLSYTLNCCLAISCGVAFHVYVEKPLNDLLRKHVGLSTKTATIDEEVPPVFSHGSVPPSL